ncbi:MAG: 4Fe-4S dicluster domain-containing protein, partial [Deltaproteobacteria bacterium]|nr:4Fe-4S dicluster domain-containing protein [Deltaproteobacteria bacterium]
WVKARQATTLVGLVCTKPCSTCFCTSVGGGPFDTTGLDVLLTEVDDVLFARALSKKGQDLLQAAGPLPAAEPGLVEQAQAVEQKAQDLITVKLDTSRLSGIDMLCLYEADFWHTVQFACINCGTCTYLCPTCWCFDIQDEAYGQTGVRMRNWDSCMFPLFTRHASGHNPRGQKLQRVRQRFMHKFKYYVDRYDKGVACVGCGRCIRHCPVNIDIREVITMMNACGV